MGSHSTFNFQDCFVFESEIVNDESYSQEGYVEELTRFYQCLNAKTGFANF